LDIRGGARKCKLAGAAGGGNMAASHAVDPAAATLLLIDLQTRLMPAIEGSAAVIANARRLRDAAVMLDVPLLYTEQNPKGLGPTVADVASNSAPVVRKMSFDASKAADFPPPAAGRPQLVVVGCEAHICVLQTVLGLIGSGREVVVVRDAVGSRHNENKEAAIARMARHGAEIVTTEMVVFEWLGTADNPRFREAAALIK
jgi:nicotinamidase-related amidase